MGDFFDGFTIDKLLAATTAYNQQRIDNRLAEMQAQAYLNGIPSVSGNPNASSNPASQTESASWIGRNGMTLLLVGAAALVAWRLTQ